MAGQQCFVRWYSPFRSKVTFWSPALLLVAAANAAAGAVAVAVFLVERDISIFAAAAAAAAARLLWSCCKSYASAKPRQKFATV